LRDCAGSGDEDENEDEDEEDPPAVIEKSKKTSFSREMADLNGISQRHGKHLRALIGEGAGQIIAVGAAVDWRSRKQKPTD